MSEVRVILKSVFDDKGIKSAQKEFGQIGKTLGVAFAAVGAAVGGAAIALTRFGLDAVRGAEEAAIAQRRLDQVAESMGLFGNAAAQVSKRLGEFAEANELIIGVDADVIKSTQAKLLTFKNLAQTADVVGGSMDRATMAALDLAATGFGSAETNAVQLGKALQDPIKGITALARAGVTFTEAEKEKIKALVESGNVLEAQNQILTAIENQVGGTAEATVSAFTRIELASNQVKDAVGEALLPVFEDLADQLVDLVPSLSAALAPAAENVAEIFRNQVLPALADFTKFLGSPQGTKMLTDLTQAVVDSIKAFIDFTAFVFQNRDAIIAIGTSMLVTVGTIKLLKTGIDLANASMVIFNGTVRKNPFIFAMTAIVALTGAVFAYDAALRKAREEAEQAAGADHLRVQIAELERQFADGTIEQDVYARSIGKIRAELALLEGQFGATIGEANRFNNLRIPNFTGQLGDTRVDGNRLAENQRQLAEAMRAAQTFTPPPAPPGGQGPSAFEETQKIVKDAQKKLIEATKRYNTEIEKVNKAYNSTVLAAEKRYQDSLVKATINRDESLANALQSHNENLATIQRNFADRQAEIIQTSIDRLRSAYAEAVSTNVAQLFGTEEVDKSVKGLVSALRDRLNASQQLLSNAGQLASQGFSQTFIEQIVSAGLESGNELATAILESTPRTQRELQSLFSALESESETGMDSLAQTMFDKTGLATTELKRLFEQTQTDLVASLTQAELDYVTSQASILTTFDEAITSARTTRDEAFAEANAKLKEDLDAAAIAYTETITAIKDAFLEQVGAVEGGLGRLKTTVESFMKALDAAMAKASLAQTLARGAGFSSPSVPTLPGPTPTRSTASQAVIDINVNAGMGANGQQIGRQIVDEIIKYEKSSGRVFARS